MTLAQVAERRINNATSAIIFEGGDLPPADRQGLHDWLVEHVPNPQGTWRISNRPHVVWQVEYDDGSHLDVLRGAVIAW